MSSALSTVCRGKGPNSPGCSPCDCSVTQQDLKEALQSPELKDAYIKNNCCIDCGHHVPSHACTPVAPGKAPL